MKQQQPAAKTCPKCGSGNYQFRSRRKITPEPGREGSEVTETKYRCKACGHEWKVRTRPGFDARRVVGAARMLAMPLPR